MFHHRNPRRWQSRGNGEPFKQVGGEGLYLGFKMYTAQGYRPMDDRLPILKSFYAQCQSEQIPILNHCTPGGAITYDMKAYLYFNHPKDTAVDGEQKRPFIKASREWTDGRDRKHTSAEDKPFDYFQEHFVSPNAWRKVLERYPRLRLCLAHFGGMTDLSLEWHKVLVPMLTEFPNLYVDISSSFTDAPFRDHFKKRLVGEHPEIIDKIMFGSDWYMTMTRMSGSMDYPKYCETAKAFIDGIDKNLWVKLSQENPYRFYRLGEQVGRVAENILKKAEMAEKQKASLSKPWESEESKREAKKAQDISKPDIVEINQRSKFIQEMASALAY